MPNSVPIAILLYERVSLSLALLPEFIFRYANKLAKEDIFKISLLGASQGFLRNAYRLDLAPSENEPTSGYLVIPPIEDFNGDFQASEDELDLLRQVAKSEARIATACLGAFFPAAAGLLDEKSATTHWAWGDYAVQHFPQVRWDVRSMLCDQGNLITAGGLLSIIDLSLYIVSESCGKRFAHELGQRLLVDSIRQKQSIYASSLLLPPKDIEKFSQLERVLAENLTNTPSIAEMAALCHMSLRSFQRHFTANYGVSPSKYIQLRKIDKAKDLLAETSLNIELIAERCGFLDLAFFRNAFSRETGMTPKAYRKRVAND